MTCLRRHSGKAIWLLTIHNLGTRRESVVTTTPRPYYTQEDPVLIVTLIAENGTLAHASKWWPRDSSCVNFDGVTALLLKIHVFWHLTLCHWMSRSTCFQNAGN